MDKKIWAGRPIFKETHMDELERLAALAEFEEGLPRSHAETKAYGTYLQQHHTAAAAHHLRGMRAAQAAGDLSEASLHGEAYHQHLSKLGYDSIDEVPETVKALLEDEGKPKHYRFKAHPADALLVGETENGESKDQKTVE